MKTVNENLKSRFIDSCTCQVRQSILEKEKFYRIFDNFHLSHQFSISFKVIFVLWNMPHGLYFKGMGKTSRDTIGFIFLSLWQCFNINMNYTTLCQFLQNLFSLTHAKMCSVVATGRSVNLTHIFCRFNIQVEYIKDFCAKMRKY